MPQDQPNQNVKPPDNPAVADVRPRIEETPTGWKFNMDIYPDDLTGQYLDRRENTPSEDTIAILSEQKKNFTESMRQQGVKEEEITAEVKGADMEPWIDPITVFAGAGGATALLTRSLTKGAIAGTIGGAAEFPIGTATEYMPPDYRLPANLAFGLISGVTLESAAEKAIIKTLESHGIQATRKAISEYSARIMEDLKSGEFQKIGMEKIRDQKGGFTIEKKGGKGKAKEPTPDEIHEEIVSTMKTDMQTETSSSVARIMQEQKKPLVEIRSAPAPEEKVATYFNTNPVVVPDKAININFNYINSEDDIKNVIYKVATAYGPDIQEARRGTISDYALGDLANSLGFPIDKILSRRKGEAFNAETILASRRVLVSSAENLRTFAQKASGIESTDLDKFNFRKALNTHYAIQAQVSGMTAEAGRALRQFQTVVSSEDAFVNQIKNSLDTLSQMERKGRTEELASLILTLDDAGKVTKFTRDMRQSTSLAMLREYWINAILSGPVTHAVNMTSNTLVAITQPVERLTGATIGRLLQTVGGGEAEIKAGEAIAQVLGIKKGIEDGFKLVGELSRIVQDEPIGNAWKHLTNVLSEPAGAGKLEHAPAITGANLGLSGNLGRAADLLGETVRIPGTALQLEDVVFKGMGYRMELWAQAYRKATSEGLKGEKLSSRIVDLVNDPTASIQKVSRDAADYQTFTAKLGDTGRALQSFLNSHPAFAFVVPFVKTPTNIFKYFGERTPLALLSKSVRDDISTGGALRDMALAKITLGTSVMTMGAMWAYEGNITGAGPKDPELNQTWRRTGWQPFSVRIGNEYISYSRLEPLGTLLGVAATIGEIAKEYEIGNIEDVDHLYAAGTIALSRNVADKTFLQGITKVLDAIEHPDERQAQYLRNLAASFEPNILAQVTQMETDPVVREVYDLIDAFKAKTPMLSETLYPKRNLWGEKIVREDMIGVPDIVNPAVKSTYKASPIDDELKKLNVGFELPRKMLKGVEMLPEERDRYIELIGNAWKDSSTGLGLKDTLSDLIRTQDYKRQSKDGKIKVVKHIVDQFKAGATNQLLQEYPDLASHIEKRTTRKAQELEPLY